MLDQSGFKQWYTYQKLRTDHQYEPEEVSFLMGKPPFYFQDYSTLSSGVKLTPEDIRVLSELFPGPRPQQLDFHKDEDFGTFEKRIIRVKQVNRDNEIRSYIKIPWTIKRKEDVKDLTLREEKLIITTEEENELRRQVEVALNDLVGYRFFRLGKSGLEIYHEIKERCLWSPILRPAYVKDALYGRIGSNRLSLTRKQGRLYFQEGLGK